MSDLVLIIIALITGFLAGVSSGLLGIGGGVIFMPFLYYFLPYAGVDDGLVSVTAIATSLFAGIFSAGSASFNHYLAKNINYKIFLLIGTGSILSTLIVPRFVIKIDPNVLSYTLLSVLIIVFIRFLFNSKTQAPERKEISSKSYFPVGILVGTLSSLCGIGGGVIIVPFLVNFTKIDMKKVIGTSSLLTALIMFSSAIVYTFLDTSSLSGSTGSTITSFIVGIPLGIGALFGARIGVKGVNKFSDILLKRIFSVFLLFVIISLLLKM